MKILHINSVCGVTGTGRIVSDLCTEANRRGHKSVAAYGEHTFYNQSQGLETISIGNIWDCRFHALMTRGFDLQGFASRAATMAFLKEVDKFQPDVIHLHNLHGYYINIEILFDYLKTREIKTLWTLHDCWPFTGHCVHFSNINCAKWKTQCRECPQKKEYPASFLFDRSIRNYIDKKSAFSGVKDMTILVPSGWLAEKVKESFLNQYRIKVVYNGIDLQQYRPIESDFRQAYGIGNRVIILGVANIWSERKGLKAFLELAELLGEEYRVVLVGLNQEQLRGLPDNVIGLERTDMVEKLAQIYSAADIFWNPSKEETFGLTVAEAIACGTWPIVYEGTACAEVVEHGIGQVVQEGVEEVRKAISAYEAREKVLHIEKYARFFSKERFADEVIEIYEGKDCRNENSISQQQWDRRCRFRRREGKQTNL